MGVALTGQCYYGNLTAQHILDQSTWLSDAKTHWRGDISIPGGRTAPGRLDSEPYGNGRRVHIQWKGSKAKYYYDPAGKQFVDADGNPAPNAINNDKELKEQAEKIWERYNGPGNGGDGGGDSSGGSGPLPGESPE